MHPLTNDFGRFVTVRGVLALLFGLVAFFLPGIALATLVMLFGAFALVDGAILIASGIGHARQHLPGWGVLVLQGVIGVAIGIVSWLLPVPTAIALLYLTAAWAILTGIAEIAVAAWLPTAVGNDRWTLGLCGGLSTLIGILFLIFPEVGLLFWIWTVGAYAFLTGVLLLVFAYNLRRLQVARRPGLQWEE